MCTHLNDVLARVSSSEERIGITREGEVVAVVIAVEDLQLYEELEMDLDRAEYRRAKATSKPGAPLSRRESMPHWAGERLLPAPTKRLQSAHRYHRC
ncbi:type II toxin-antitoxin system Phd/YefM family antitoxin [Dermatophilus congolensis]|uniref:type II toxin-antitoxin system Phd/YefM family antitoxin n=1 Tax=Dermatophilus congolensis TaxID=1863 RepID=UPI003C7A2F0B